MHSFFWSDCLLVTLFLSPSDPAYRFSLPEHCYVRHFWSRYPKVPTKISEKNATQNNWVELKPYDRLPDSGRKETKSETINSESSSKPNLGLLGTAAANSQSSSVSGSAAGRTSQQASASGTSASAAGASSSHPVVVKSEARSQSQDSCHSQAEGLREEAPGSPRGASEAKYLTVQYSSYFNKFLEESVLGRVLNQGF